MQRENKRCLLASTKKKTKTKKRGLFDVYVLSIRVVCVTAIVLGVGVGLFCRLVEGEGAGCVPLGKISRKI